MPCLSHSVLYFKPSRARCSPEGICKVCSRHSTWTTHENAAHSTWLTWRCEKVNRPKISSGALGAAVKSRQCSRRRGYGPQRAALRRRWQGHAPPGTLSAPRSCTLGAHPASGAPGRPGGERQGHALGSEGQQGPLGRPEARARSPWLVYSVPVGQTALAGGLRAKAGSQGLRSGRRVGAMRMVESDFA